MLDGLAGRQLVEDLVSELPGRVQAVQDGRGCALAEPGARRCPAGPPWRGRGRGPAAAGGSARPGRRAGHAAAAPPCSGRTGRRAMRPGCPQSGQLRQKPGSGRVQAEHSGSLAGAAADRPGLTAAGAPDPALLAGAAPGLAGRLGDHAGRVLPADRAGQRSSRARSSRTAARPGARTLTGRRRPQPAQVSWLAGSVIRQCGHSGWPCSSRAAACGWLRSVRRAGSGTWPRSCGSTTARRAAGAGG